MGWFCLKGKREKSSEEEPLLVRDLTAVRFEKKTEDEVLKYVYMNWKDLQQDSSVIEALKETNFVTSADGGLYKPKDLFDPGDALLTSLFSSDKFPGKRFASKGWLKILRKLGLQNTRDAEADTVLQCARRIEFLGAQSMMADSKNKVSSKVWSLAETLIKTVFETAALLHDQSFCNVFGKIACVPAKKGYPFDNPFVKKVVCSYSDAILLKDWALGWSVAPILSKVPPDYSWGALQLRSPPPFPLVFQHLQPMAVVPISFYLAREEAAVEVLNYLDTIWGTLSSSDVDNLKRLPFIPTVKGPSTMLATRYIIHLKINLWPLAHELPLCYLPFVKILKELGLHETLTISSAMKLIELCRNLILSPNVLLAVIELLNFIEQQKPDRTVWESELFVPDINRRLVPSSWCVYIDPLGSRYVKYVDYLKLRLVHQDVSERLCLAFGIRKLSDIVVEELDCAKDLETVEEIGSVSLAAIKVKLLSRSFQVAVSSVVNDFSSVTSGFKNSDFSTLQRSLESVAERLRFVRCLYTRFWLLPESLDITRASVIPEWESDSGGHRALYYVDRSNTCMLIAEPPTYMRVVDLVAIVVSNVLGSPVQLPIGSLFLCPHDSETHLAQTLF